MLRCVPSDMSFEKSNLIPALTDRDAFPRWRKLAYAFFRRKCLRHYIEGGKAIALRDETAINQAAITAALDEGTTPPDAEYEEEDAINVAKKMDSAYSYILHLCFELDIFEDVEEGDAVGAWQAVVDYCIPDDDQGQSNKLEEWAQLKMQDNETLTQFIARWKRLYNLLSAFQLGPTLPEKRMRFLNGLPDSFDTFRRVHRNHPPATLKKLEKLALAEETALNTAEKREIALNSNASRMAGKPQGNGRTKKIRCWYCKARGHAYQDCSVLHNKLKNGEDLSLSSDDSDDNNCEAEETAGAVFIEEFVGSHLVGTHSIGVSSFIPRDERPIFDFEEEPSDTDCNPMRMDVFVSRPI